MSTNDTVPTLTFHPVADLFPLLAGEELAGLAEDVRVNGLHVPIVVIDDIIVDGRNRYRALEGLQQSGALLGRAWGSQAGKALGLGDLDPKGDSEGKVPLFRQYDASVDGDPLAFVLSTNLHRRHLDESQRSMIATRLATMRKGARTDLAQIQARSQAEAARDLNVSRTSVQSAKFVQDHGTPDLIAAVDSGKLSVSEAKKAAKLSPELQNKVAAEAKAGRLNIARGKVKTAARAKREKDLAAKITALPDKKFGVILADPPWTFEVWSEKGEDRSASNHYPVQTDEEIAALEVKDIAADVCTLFLWVTSPKIEAGLAVLAAWGFRYASQFVWAKAGTGYWNRCRHEILLLGVKGDPPAPAPGEQWESLISAPVGKHSEKPEKFYELIEAYFPNLPKIELNARKRRGGWDAWGLEAPPDEAPAPKANGGDGHVERNAEIVAEVARLKQGDDPKQAVNVVAARFKLNPRSVRKIVARAHEAAS